MCSAVLVTRCFDCRLVCLLQFRLPRRRGSSVEPFLDVLALVRCAPRFDLWLIRSCIRCTGSLLLALLPPALLTPCPFLLSVIAFLPETSLSSAFLFKRLLGIPLSAGCFYCTPEVLISLGGGRVNVLGVLSPSRSALRECE
jgi:hypothetical protein